MDRWKSGEIANEQLQPAPEDLSSRMFSLTSELWNQALQIAAGRLASDRLIFEVQIRNLREDHKSVASAADRAIEER